MTTYNEDSIRSLDWKEHIRLRPGMYIGKLGDGAAYDDGIYVLLKEIVDNCIDEFVMGAGRSIDITVSESKVSARDYGRGIPLGSVVDVVSKINTGGKYDSKAFQKSVGLNGVGSKAVNALSNSFTVQSYRGGKTRIAEFSQGVLLSDTEKETTQRNGTAITFIPDEGIFRNYKYRTEFIENMIWNYVFLNAGLTINFNGNKYISENGLKDLLERNVDMEAMRYPIIHLRGEDIEIAITHGQSYGEEYYSFVNGQHTTQGGTHQAAFREAVVKTVREFYKKEFDASDVRSSIIAAIAIKVQEPVFESQTKTKLGSQSMGPEGPTVRTFINDFVKKALDDYLHKNQATADNLLKRILQSERERKDIAGIKKLANDRAKKASLHNRKLRDCKIHYDDKHERNQETTLFITEGDSASGTITKARNAETQAVFSLRGKPINCYKESRKKVAENEELNLLINALGVEDDMDNLRYNKIIVATDADDDGMHIRMLVLTFFMKYYPDLIRRGHVHILQTPLFRVKNKKDIRYCFSIEEKEKAVKELKTGVEITRFKGLGEISSSEFVDFIGENMRLDRVKLSDEESIAEIMEFYMGDNTIDRQNFIRQHLRSEAELEDVNI